jgi:hypothetical protein
MTKKMMTTAAVGEERGERGEVNNSYDNIIALTSPASLKTTIK